MSPDSCIKGTKPPGQESGISLSNFTHHLISHGVSILSVFAWHVINEYDSKETMNDKNSNKVINSQGSVNKISGFLKKSAPFLLAVGAMGSIVLVLLAGQHSNQKFLQFLFAVWVSSPFGVLALINKFSKRWSSNTQFILHCLILFMTVISLAIYLWIVIKPPSSELAFPFVVVPLGSWLFIIVITFIALISNRHSQH